MYDHRMEMGPLRRSIADLLQVDLDSLSDREVHLATVELERLTSQLAAARARFVGAWDARKIWAEDGSKSPAARLARECRLDPEGTARVDVRRARKLRTMPVVAKALERGRLSLDHADLLIMANTSKFRPLFARDEAMLVDQIASMRYSTAKKAVAYWKSKARDALDDPLDERQHSDRNACCDRTINGGVHVSAFLPSVPGTIVLDEWRRLERQLFEHDLAAARESHGDEALAHLSRTHTQRMADALVVMATRSAGAVPTSQASPLFTVLVGYETFAGRVCEIDDGTVVEPEELRPYLSTANVERVVFSGPNRVIEVGARTRFFTGALRRAIEVRDKHCQHPSECDVPARDCQVNHKIEYEDGGETTQSNGDLQCGFHNRFLHRAKRRRQADIVSLEKLREKLRARYEEMDEPLDGDDDFDDDGFIDTG
jgi:hypothetical protein